jgi:hypothetical protein
MRRSIRVAAATAALFLVLPVATVQATPPLAVEFEVETSFIGGGPVSGGPFTASGAAVDAGLICAAGDTIDYGIPLATAFQSGIRLNIHIVKQFSCTDGSGDFWLALNVGIDARGTHFVWSVMDGTGDYERLHGTGSGVGLPGDGFDVLDLYSGGLHID